MQSNCHITYKRYKQKIGKGRNVNHRVKQTKLKLHTEIEHNKDTYKADKL